MWHYLRILLLVLVHGVIFPIPTTAAAAAAPLHSLLSNGATEQGWKDRYLLTGRTTGTYCQIPYKTEGTYMAKED